MSSRPPNTRQRMITLKSYAKQRQSNSASPIPTPISQKNQNSKQDLPKDSEEYLQHLIRKIFFPSIECSNYQDILPSLTSSNAIDIQLYTLIGLLIRSFVQSWYSRITDDQEFINELIGVISHITRNLETRIRENIDVELLLLDDLPFILDEHLKTYREVHLKLGSSFLPFDTIDKGFDSLKQHAAMTENEQDEALYLKLLCKNFVGLLLPEDEKNSKLAKLFVEDLMSDLILRSVLEKMIQPYQIFEIFTLICEIILGKNDKSETKSSKDEDIKETKSEETSKLQTFTSKLSHLVAYTTFLYQSQDISRKKYVVSFHIFSFLENFFKIGIHRPILYGAFKTISSLCSNEKINNLLSNLLNNTFIKTMKSDALYATIIKALRNNLFPTDENMGPARIEPTMEEFEKIRKKTKDSIKQVCLKFKILSDLIIASDENEVDDVVDDFLTSFEHKRINKHLLFSIIDLIVSKLFSELSS